MDNWLTLMAALTGAFLILTLAGCGPNQHVQVVKPPLVLPDNMFQCNDGGSRPKGEVIMESEVARYIAGLEYANKDCATQMKELQILVKCYNDKDCNVEKLIEFVGLVKQEKSR